MSCYYILSCSEAPMVQEESTCFGRLAVMMGLCCFKNNLCVNEFPLVSSVFCSMVEVFILFQDVLSLTPCLKKASQQSPRRFDHLLMASSAVASDGPRLGAALSHGVDERLKNQPRQQGNAILDVFQAFRDPTQFVFRCCYSSFEYHLIESHDTCICFSNASFITSRLRNKAGGLYPLKENARVSNKQRNWISHLERTLVQTPKILILELQSALIVHATSKVRMSLGFRHVKSPSQTPLTESIMNPQQGKYGKMIKIWIIAIIGLSCSEFWRANTYTYQYRPTDPTRIQMIWRAKPKSTQPPAWVPRDPS